MHGMDYFLKSELIWKKRNHFECNLVKTLCKPNLGFNIYCYLKQYYHSVLSPQQLAAILITRQIIGNLKEAFLPYFQWKAKLYKVGYEMTKDLITPDNPSQQFTDSPGSDPSKSPGDDAELSSPDGSNMEQCNSVEEKSKEMDGITDCHGVRQRGAMEGENQKTKENFQTKSTKPLSLTQAEVESAMKQVQNSDACIKQYKGIKRHKYIITNKHM